MTDSTRNTLRRLELKVSVEIEARLGMRKVDVEDARFEMELRNKTKQLGPESSSQQFNLGNFSHC